MREAEPRGMESSQMDGEGFRWTVLQRDGSVCAVCIRTFKGSINTP